MSKLVRNSNIILPRLRTFVALLALVIPAVSCSRSASARTEKTVQRTFASPADAGAAVFEAAKSGNQDALIAIFGPDGRDILFSEDAVKDKNSLQDFVSAYGQMHRWVKIKGGGEMLNVGADNFPFPVPLQKNSSGQWYFNTAAGKDEILARRIGKNELSAIAAADSIASAEQQYFSQTHDGSNVRQYAQKFVSDPGRQNGLYWPVPEGQAQSPLGQLGDFAKVAGYTNPGEKTRPFNGYYFRILTKQGSNARGGAKDYIVNGNMTGGFAILAYPAEYRNSGIMTFMVGKDGVVYQKDLGEKTKETAAAMTEYDPSNGWRPALESSFRPPES